MNARETAVDVLCRSEGEYANLLLKDALSGLDIKDRGLASAIVYGCLANRTRLDYVISNFCNFDKPDDTVKNILRSGAYQILFMDRVPPSAAVNESVIIAKRRAPYAAGFVNGVLRKVASEEVALPEKDKNLVRYLKVKYSFPASIIKKWIAMFGEDEAEKLLSAMNEPQPTYARINMRKEGAENCALELGERELPNLVRLSHGMDIKSSPLYNEGYFTVMQKSSVLACNLSGAKPGMKVLDMCAAPGGKTLYLAELMNDEGSITAWDIYPHRTGLIDKNAQRLGISIVKTQTRDASVFDKTLENSFDLVLLDAPCSGYGVIAQKPDIKWRKREGGLPEIQGALIANAARYVKPGGVLLYCTCTINDDENEKIVKTVADAFDIEEMKTYLPHRDGTNGFFAAKMRKKL